jgi:putative ABC transport system permease protein
MTLLKRLGGLWRRRRANREADEELPFHVAMETEANLARGMSAADARHAALRALGGVTQAKEMVLEVRTLGVESVWQDVRYATRTLAFQAGFTLTAAVMLSVATGMSTAMFTLVDSLVLRPVPFHDPAQLANLWMGDEHGGWTTVTPAVLKSWRGSPAFDAAEGADTTLALLGAGDTVVARTMATVTPGVFDLLGGVRPTLGRLFAPGEGGPGASDRVLVSETVWRTLYDADPALVGRMITIDRERLMVVGILPADFRFPSADTVLWRPKDVNAGNGERVRAYVRFSSTMPRQDALRLATAAAAAADPGNAALRPYVDPLAGLQDEYSRLAVPLVAGCVVLVFLILCANVCSLVMARLTSRRREFRLRAALGASRGRLMRQAIIESAVLGTIGLAGGIALAWLLVAVAGTLIPPQLLLQSLNPLDVDGRALAATSAAGLLAIVGFGVLPAWLGTRVDACESLRVHDRGGTDTRAARRLTRGLVAFEVALACTLLVGAMLLTRSFVKLASADRGLDSQGVTTLWLSIDPSRSLSQEGRAAVVRTVDEELRSLPGVQRIAWSYGLPPDGGMMSWGNWVSDLAGGPTFNGRIARYVVSQDFFALYGIAMVGGRTFTPADRFSDVIVSERLAQALWPDLSPIGRTFRLEKDEFHVVGVAREIHYPTVDGRLDGPEFYHPYLDVAPTPMVSLRCVPACPDPAVIRYRLAVSHPAVRVQRAQPLGERYESQLARPRAAAAVLGAFAAIALVAAVGGLFSVLSYTVSRRRREFGIRTALGASPGDIRGVVFRDALGVAVFGLTIGVWMAAALARALASLQYGVGPADPLSWSVVFGLIPVTAILAAWRPALVAGRADPSALLREE